MTTQVPSDNSREHYFDVQMDSERRRGPAAVACMSSIVMIDSTSLSQAGTSASLEEVARQAGIFATLTMLRCRGYKVAVVISGERASGTRQDHCSMRSGIPEIEEQ